MWWTPDLLFEEFFGTDAEFVPVILPQPTQECYEHRPPRGSMCNEDFVVETMSDPLGSCDYAPQSIKKFISDGLYSTTYDPAIPEPLQSPAYETIENYRMTELQLNQILQMMLEHNVDYNFDARYATCKWVVDNLDHVLSFIPESHPRAIRQVDHSTSPVFIGSLVIACLSVIVVLFSFVSIAMKRNTKVVFYAQLETLAILLVGLLVLSVGSVLMVVPYSDGSCVSIAWLINIGYAIHFAPLVTKVFAINNFLATSGKQMQRVRLSKLNLYRGVVLLTSLVIGFMVAWTIKDPPEKVFHYKLVDETTDDGESVVCESNTCGSSNEVWQLVSLAWQAAVLLPTAVVAFVACRVKEDMNDTKSLSMVVYCHSFFLIFRSALVFMDDGTFHSDLMAYRSILISGDILFSIAIYFFPKLKDSEESDADDEILPDLFLNSSIMVADVIGFAAWSSAREPHQVFKLLETLYETFDTIADKHDVFKVETVRDCYGKFSCCHTTAKAIYYRSAKDSSISLSYLCFPDQLLQLEFHSHKQNTPKLCVNFLLTF